MTFYGEQALANPFLHFTLMDLSSNFCSKGMSYYLQNLFQISLAIYGIFFFYDQETRKLLFQRRRGVLSFSLVNLQSRHVRLEGI